MTKTAFVTGVSGQDGAYLSKLLLEKGYHVVGGERRTASGSLWRLASLGIERDVEIADLELAEFTNIYRTIERHKPDEIYNLAAQSYVAASFEMPTMTGDITGLGVCRLLEAIRSIDAGMKFYQASTSELFGNASQKLQDEDTPFHPRSPYGAAKLYGHWIAVNYREAYGMFCCSGIMFNHESPLRGKEFVTRKISSGIAEIMRGERDHIELGNIEASRDWGFAGDYVEAMHSMLQQDDPDDYVIATGESHTVKEFVEVCFNYVGMRISWKGSGVHAVGIDQDHVTRVKINPTYFRPADVEHLGGDAGKARKVLGWSPKTSFVDLAEQMMEADLRSDTDRRGSA
ncbi:GDP-mannose 4,6-dehydratase [Candidatus Bipolaricaulota bacterium]